MILTHIITKIIRSQSNQYQMHLNLPSIHKKWFLFLIFEVNASELNPYYLTSIRFEKIRHAFKTFHKSITNFKKKAFFSSMVSLK